MAELLTGVSPYAPNLVLQTTPEWHLARRACMGATAEIANDIARAGYENWIDEQLDWENLPDEEYELEKARLFEAYGLTSQEMIAIAGGGTQPYRSPAHFQSAVVHEQWTSKRQLKSSMLTFMLDAVNVEFKKAEFTTIPHLTVIRKHCLGKYSDLLKAAYRDGGVQEYLDNDGNTKNAVTENLGRELLELHTIGTVYTQDDVIAVSRMLTGYRGYYEMNDHYMGEQTVFGQKFPNMPKSNAEGFNQIDDLIDFLTRTRATAVRLARRLAIVFVTDEPNDDFVNRLADVYLQNDTDVRPVLKTLFMSDEFKNSVGQKIRKPQQLQASIWASGNVTVRPQYKSSLVDSSYPPYETIISKYLHRAGHVPLSWLYPDGFPVKSSRWISTTILLANISLDSCVMTNDVLLTVATFNKGSKIVVNKDTWNDAVTKMYEYITGWKVTDAEFRKPAAGLAANNSSIKPPNMLTKPTSVAVINALATPVIRSPFMLIS